MKKYISRLIFFLGWLLSPLTFWNDAFVNIPLAYILANLFRPVVHIAFLTLVLIFYWVTNIVGIVIMLASGRGVLAKGRGAVKEAISLVATMALYSALLFLIDRLGILRPIF